MNKLLTFGVWVWMVIAAPLAVAGDVPAFSEGKQYQAVQPVPPVGKGEQVEVVEFFWYGCGHCDDFEPFLKTWEEDMPENVEFQRIPAIFPRSATMLMHAKVYYALELMGLAKELHPAIFAAIHDDGLNLRTLPAMEAFLKDHAVDMDAFRTALNSFAVQTKVRRSEVLLQRYGVRGVPGVVVDGRYRTANVETYPEMIEVINFMVDKVREERSATK